MQVCINVKRICASLQDMVGFRRRKDGKRQLQISQPFNFKKETTILPGLTHDEITVLREKAAASCLGIADHLHSRSSTPDYTHPRQPPPIPIRASSRGSVPMGLMATEDMPFLSSSLPTSSTSSHMSNAMDLDLGSPISPLTTRGSPRSVRSRLLC